MGSYLQTTSLATYETGRDRIENIDPNEKPRNVDVIDFEGKERFLGEFFIKKNKAILVVNISFKCEKTKKELKRLKRIYDKYKVYGLEILAFYSPEFSKEKLELKEIKSLISSKYSLTFPIFSKISLNGPNTHQFYSYLKINTPKLKLSEHSVKNIPWDFSKFILDSDYNIKEFYEPHVDYKVVLEEIEEMCTIKKISNSLRNSKVDY